MNEQNRRSFRLRLAEHPPEVTADRLAEAVEKWPGKFADLRDALDPEAERTARTERADYDEEG